MKQKLFLSIMALMMTVSLSYAQITVGFSTGFHGGAFKSNIGATVDINSDGEATVANNYYSLGGGIPLTLNLGIPIMDNVSFDLGFNYWLGSTVTVMTTDDQQDDETEEFTATSKQFRILPGITIGTDEGLYGRVGLVLPLGGSTKSIYMGESDAGKTEITYMSYGNFALGAYTGLGYRFEIADNIHLFGELQALALNIKSKSMEIVELDDPSGVDLDDFPTAYKETVYVDELDKNSNTETNPDFDEDDPMEELARVTSFGAWGINIGITITLGR